MFKLNEAPDMVLAAIDTEKAKRGCGTFWSVLFCLPTLGGSIDLCNDQINNGRDYVCCCYPKSVSNESDVTLGVLIDKLKLIRASRTVLTKNTEIDEHKLVEWQVKETIKLLQTATNENIIQGSYRTALAEVLVKIRTQAAKEEEYGKLLDTEKSPLSGHQPYTPSYGLV